MTIKNISRIVIATAGLWMLTGCHIYKKYEAPQDDELLAEYAQAKEAEEDSAAFGNLDWREVFTDPLLADLIDRALENNKDLQNAKLNIDIAHAQLKGARLNFLPSVALSPNGAGASYDGSHMAWSYQIPLSVSWEIDVFGKLLNSKRSAQAALLQSEAYQQAVRSQIIGAVANCYYQIAALESQLKLSRETAISWKESVEVMKNLKLAGRVDETAVVQSTANYYGILAAIPDLEVSLTQANNTMSLLLNVLPQKWEIPPTTIVVPAIARDGVPMRELAARPDVRAAEQSLAVAYYATNQARAAFYPGLTISAEGGFTNLLGSVIQNPGVWFAQVAGSLVAPLFSRGTNIANLEATKAQQQQALNDFEYSLLNASAEVSDAMILTQKSEEKAKLLEKETENLEKSVEYTQELLTLGTSTYLEVLTAQQSLLSSQMSQISCELSKAQAVINLYQSLGGGR